MFKIALVDDHELFRKSLIFVLEQIETIEVVFDTNDGTLLLQYLQNNTVDLVLLDIQMPIMDGYTASKAIRALGINLPIIALTANLRSDIEVQAFEAGMNDIIVKPFMPEELYKKVNKYLMHIN